MKTMAHNDRTPFLQLVADDIYRRSGGDVSKITVVFPSRRASVFFNRYLYEAAGSRALWAPRYITISELFQELSPLSINDPIDTICRLFRHYRETTHDEKAQLDWFYGWGERLLADFDDIDKSVAITASGDDMVRQLFTNISDLKELDTMDYLTEEQREVLRRFFSNFEAADDSVVRQRFLTLWRQMYTIYSRLNDELRQEGLAYEGALFRDVVREKRYASNDNFYVFVGHNALSNIERELLRQLQREQRAWFYWDYDVYYMQPSNEASFFIRNNLKEFPNNLQRDAYFDNFSSIEKMEYVSSPTENAQARSITSWVEEHLGDDPTRTAIVLASENLLLPVIHSLPSDVQDVNITKGFPLGHTQAFAMVDKFFSNTKETDLHTLLLTLRTKIEEAAKTIYEAALTPADDADPGETLTRLLETEAWHYTHAILNRFITIVESGRMEFQLPTTLHRLLRYALRQASIPFEGEPAIGLQIMGMLETRCLDFDNVLILSANEKVLPRVGSDASFIPYFVRKAFGLPVVNHRTAIQAYYFYRLLQRAKNVRCVYNISTEGMSTGEMSRYMTQMLVEWGGNIEHIALTAMPGVQQRQPEPLAKPKDMLQKLRKDDEQETDLLRLSPTAINDYLRCPLQFYYKYICKLSEPDVPSDEITLRVFGNLCHKAAELTYKYLSRDLRMPVQASQIEALLAPGSRQVWQFVQQAFNEMEPKVDFNGVVAEVLEVYLKRMLRYDLTLAKEAPITIRGLEDKHYVVITTPQGHKVSIGGSIDRLDEVEINGVSTLRVVDYKTGTGKEEALASAEDLSPLFVPSPQRSKYLLQTFLYCYTLGENVRSIPALYFLSRSITDPTIKVNGEPMTDFGPLREKYLQGLCEVIDEILDPDVPFEPHTDKCATCPFYLLCHA